MTCKKPDCCQYGPAFSATEFNDIITKHGDGAAKVVLDALKVGFSKALIQELLVQLGPVGVAQAVNSKRLAEDVAGIMKTRLTCIDTIECKPEDIPAIMRALDEQLHLGVAHVTGPPSKADLAAATEKLQKVLNEYDTHSDIFGRSPLVFGDINHRFGHIIQGEPTDPSGAQTNVMSDPIISLIQQLLPILVTTDGPAIVSWLVSLVTTALQNPANQTTWLQPILTSLVQYIVNSLQNPAVAQHLVDTIASRVSVAKV